MAQVRSKGSRTRPKTYAQLKRALDAIFSQFVRRSNADRNGNVSCYTCGVRMHWKEAHAGHWITRNHLATRWDERNTAPQCPACNLFRAGQPQLFAQRLMKDYGVGIIDQLIAESRKTVKLSRADLQAQIEDYQKRLEGL